MRLSGRAKNQGIAIAWVAPSSVAVVKELQMRNILTLACLTLSFLIAAPVLSELVPLTPKEHERVSEVKPVTEERHPWPPLGNSP